MPKVNPFSRQFLSYRAREAVKTAIASGDQKYGRQLASMFEKLALTLRSEFNGKPLWGLGLRSALRRKKDASAAPKPVAAAPPPPVEHGTRTDLWGAEGAVHAAAILETPTAGALQAWAKDVAERAVAYIVQTRACWPNERILTMQDGSELLIRP